MGIMNIYDRANTREFLTFSLVGLSGFAVDIGFFNLFLHLGLSVFLSAALSLPIAATSNWFFNRRFTFKSAHAKRASLQWSQYLIVSLFAFGLNLTIFWFGYTVLRLGGNLSKALAAFLVWFWNYFANKHWTFKAKITD